MKIITIVAASLFVLTLGCQSAVPPAVGSGDDPLESAKTIDSAPSVTDHDEEAEKDAPRISLADAKEAFDEGGAVFVDTRAATFYQNERIKGALNVPSSDFEDNYKAVPKNKKVIAYCS